MRNFNIIFILIFISFVSCKKDSNESISKNQLINDFNILIVPDLSNRINSDIYPKPIHDTILINSLVDNIDNFLRVGNRSLNQLDIYKLDFINKGILNQNIVQAENLQISFMQFDKKPIEFSDYRRNKLGSDSKIFKNNVISIYDYSLKNTVGADVWNYFNETINASLVKREPIEIKIPEGSGNNLIKQTKNVVVLFTDGYIENANNKKGYTLDKKLIDKIRKDFKTSKIKDLKEFILSKPEYLLINTDNDLSDVNIIIFEIFDRSLTVHGVAKEHPTDFQIMKIIWEKWLTDSGSPLVKINEVLNQKAELNDRMIEFLKEINKLDN